MHNIIDVCNAIVSVSDFSDKKLSSEVSQAIKFVVKRSFLDTVKHLLKNGSGVGMFNSLFAMLIKKEMIQFEVAQHYLDTKSNALFDKNSKLKSAISILLKILICLAQLQKLSSATSRASKSHLHSYHAHYINLLLLQNSAN